MNKKTIIFNPLGVFKPMADDAIKSAAKAKEAKKNKTAIRNLGV